MLTEVKFFAWTIFLRPRTVLWHAQWLKFLKNRLMEWDTEDSKWFHAVQYAGKAGPLVWCRYTVVWSDNTLKWDGSMLIAKPNSTDSEKNEDWRNGCLTAPRFPHPCLGKGVRGRKRAVYLLRCVPVLGNCATTILKTGCCASWTTWTRGWCFSQISGAPPPCYIYFLFKMQVMPGEVSECLRTILTFIYCSELQTFPLIMNLFVFKHLHSCTYSDAFIQRLTNEEHIKQLSN